MSEPPATSAGANHLFIEDRLKQLLPGWLYFPYKIAKEARRNEPELKILRELVRPGCTAIDVGANRGLYSYALSKVAQRVEAFEPNPAVAVFTRGKIGHRVRLHELALSDRDGAATFYMPRTADGASAHLLGNLRNVHVTSNTSEIEVRVATLDSFGFDNVGFIKVDVEGSELDVIEGARRTIARDRPNLLLELLGGPNRDVLAAIDKVEQGFGYRSWIIRGGTRQDARAALVAPFEIKSKNVLFTPA